MKKHLYFLIASFLSLQMCVQTTSAITEEKDAKTIKIAAILDHGFFYLDENGGLSGYSYDYLQLMAQHTGWNYEFVLIDEGTSQGGNEAGYNKAMDLMVQGEVDLIGTVFSSENTEELFEFPAYHTGISRYCLMSSANNYKMTMDNYFLQDVISVALIEGHAVNQEFLDLFDLRGIVYETTYVPTYWDALELLETEQVDTMLMTDTSYDSGKVSYLTTIDRNPFYFVAEKGNTALVEELEQGINALNVIMPNLHQDLLEKYFGQSSDSHLKLTDEEALALEDYDYLSVGMFYDFAPYSTYSEEDALPHGISVEILNLLSQIIGIEFRYVPIESIEDLVEKVAKKEVDFMGILPAYFNFTQYLSLVSSVPYVESSTLWLSQGGIPSDQVFLYMVSDNIPFYTPEQIGITYDIESAILELSKNGASDIFCERNIATYQLNQLGIDNIEVQMVNNVSSNIALGMGQHLDVAIMGVLNKGIGLLDEDAVELIILDHMTVKDTFTFAAVLAKYGYVFNAIALGTLSLIVLGLWYHSNKFKRLSRQDSMTKLTNSGHFHQYAEETTKTTAHGCLILVDIDLFKNVNDTHGHQKGDEVILTVARFIQEHFRQGDTVARLGGDEFAILLETSCKKEDLENKFRNILTELADNPTGISISLSVGGHIFNEPIPYKELYNLADKNLYKVKENGRNGFVFS